MQSTPADPKPIPPAPKPAKPTKPKVVWNPEAVKIFNGLSQEDQRAAAKAGCTLTDVESFKKFLATKGQ